MDVANRMRCGMEDARSNSFSDYKTTYRPLALVDRAVSGLLVGGQRVTLRIPTSRKLLETNVQQVGVGLRHIGLAAFGTAHDADERDESDDVGDATKDSAAAIRTNTLRTRLMQCLSERTNGGTSHTDTRHGKRLAMTQEMKACGFDLVSSNSTFVDLVFALMAAVITAMETSDVRPNTKHEYSKLRNVLDMRARESYHSEKTLMTMACSPALNLRYGQLLGIHVLANLSDVYGLYPVTNDTNAMSRNMFNRDRDWSAVLLATFIRLRVCTNGLPTYAQSIMLRGYIRGMGLEENCGCLWRVHDVSD